MIATVDKGTHQAEAQAPQSSPVTKIKHLPDAADEILVLSDQHGCGEIGTHMNIAKTALSVQDQIELERTGKIERLALQSRTHKLGYIILRNHVDGAAEGNCHGRWKHGPVAGDWHVGESFVIFPTLPPHISQAMTNHLSRVREMEATIEVGKKREQDAHKLDLEVQARKLEQEAHPSRKRSRCGAFVYAAASAIGVSAVISAARPEMVTDLSGHMCDLYGNISAALNLTSCDAQYVTQSMARAALNVTSDTAQHAAKALSNVIFLPAGPVSKLI